MSNRKLSERDEALLNAIRVMEKVRDLKRPFEMNMWFADESRPQDCGTAACFGGWLCRDSYFQDRGLTIRVAEGHLHPAWGGEVAIAAIGAALCLPAGVVMWLCLSSNYPPGPITPAGVIARLRALLSEQAAELSVVEAG